MKALGKMVSSTRIKPYFTNGDPGIEKRYEDTEGREFGFLYFVKIGNFSELSVVRF